MSNELIIPESNIPQKYTEEDMEKIASNTEFARIQLYGSNSQDVKDGRMTMGHFGCVVGKEIQDMGPTFDCIPIAWHPKAMLIVGDEVHAYYDIDSPEFQKIQEDSDNPDNEISNGNMYGPEYLLWVPTLDRFVPYFLGNKSSRYVAKAFSASLGRAATVSAQLVKKGKYSWHAPKVTACNVPIENVPDADKLKEEVDRFYNPEASGAEMAKAAESDRAV